MCPSRTYILVIFLRLNLASHRWTTCPFISWLFMFRDSNPLFCEKLLELEADPITQGLSLQSFLTLPMQRITRLPLLVDVGLLLCYLNSWDFRAPQFRARSIFVRAWKSILVSLFNQLFSVCVHMTFVSHDMEFS